MERSVAPRDGAAKRSAEARRLRWNPVGARRVGGGRKCMQQRYLAVGHAQKQPGVFHLDQSFAGERPHATRAPYFYILLLARSHPAGATFPPCPHPHPPQDELQSPKTA